MRIDVLRSRTAAAAWVAPEERCVRPEGPPRLRCRLAPDDWHRSKATSMPEGPDGLRGQHA
eukprot:298655-Chlamydomonas_euryale.AAC.1